MRATRTTTWHSALGLVAALRAPDRRAETTNLVAVDERGDACAITTSLGLGSEWGARLRRAPELDDRRG